ncbi:reverse transcriptase [Senna tora]|uniref:Reverse transcriptase n=1 Tax=Senna tora TaxID=362788 RepID=A0A834TW23_9FABA|nr:reverse transcriptase [Senna tora]
MDNFNSFLNNCNLLDLGFVGPLFTWTNCQQDGHIIRTRIDRAHATHSWINLFPNSKVYHLPRAHSDHCPILLNSNPLLLNDPKPFRLEPFWLHHPTFFQTTAYLDDGSFNFNPLIVRNSVINFFITNYTSCPPTFPLKPTPNLPIFNADFSDSLILPPLISEIRSVTFSLPPLKAPGKDGFHVIFFRKSWDIIQHSLSNEINKVFSSSSIPKEWGETLISLIPKIDNASKPSQLRPIGLCSSHYKILAKVLANRLKPFLPNLISPFQGAFQKEKHTSDLFISAHEIMHSMNKSQSKNGWLILKIDLHKAFDTISWSFINSMLSRFNFLSAFINLISSCISSVDYTLLFNASMANSHIIKNILTDFSNVSGLDINFSKSKLWFSPTTPPADIDNISSIFNINVSDNLGSYLGYPLKPSYKNSDFNFILDKFQNKLSSWKTNLLSFSSRLQLIKSTTSSLHSHIMQAIFLPINIHNKIDKINRNFLWGHSHDSRKLHYVNWNTITQPKTFGGLAKYGQNLERNIHSKSYIRRSLDKGLSVFNLGLAWRIGNGLSINFWHDKWLPSGTVRSSISGPLSLQDSHKSVSNVLSNGLSDMSLSLPPSIIDEISSSFISLNNSPDLPAWPTSKSGAFSIKSAYYLTLNLSSFSHMSSFPNLNWLWKVPCHPRVSSFLWKSFHYGLPTASRLFNINCIPSPVCSLCNSHSEDILHVLRDCSFSNSIWLFFHLPPSFFSLDFRPWLHKNLSTSDISLLGIPWNIILAYIIYNILIARNNKIFKNIPFISKKVYSSAISSCSEFFFLNSPPSSSSSNSFCLIKWNPPKSSFFKLNIDGSAVEGKLGASGVIRNDNGCFIVGSLSLLARVLPFKRSFGLFSWDYN